MEPRRILLAVTGGIAAYKVPELVRALRRAGHAVRCAMTEEATRFVAPLVLQTLTGEAVRQALFDPSEAGEIDHIRLADWADLVVVAPATANMLAKMSHGVTDDLVTALLLATRAPVLVAPAMNVNMWQHAATRAERGRSSALAASRIVGPEPGELACGWEGELGRMSEPEDIAAAAALVLGKQSLAHEKVLVTAGGTARARRCRALASRTALPARWASPWPRKQRAAAPKSVWWPEPTSLATPAGVQRVDVETCPRDAAGTCSTSGRRRRS